MEKWHKVSDGTPRKNHDVLIIDKNKEVKIGHYVSDNDGWATHGTYSITPTHWTPIPFFDGE